MTDRPNILTDARADFQAATEEHMNTDNVGRRHYSKNDIIERLAAACGVKSDNWRVGTILDMAADRIESDAARIAALEREANCGCGISGCRNVDRECWNCRTCRQSAWIDDLEAENKRLREALARIVSEACGFGSIDLATSMRLVEAEAKAALSTQAKGGA